MRFFFMLLITISLAFAANPTQVSEKGTGTVPSYMPTDMELSWDLGTPFHAWVYNTGAGSYAAVDFSTPSGSHWYLKGIKYAICTTWPDEVFQGFNTCAWKMESGIPTSIVWPASGVPEFSSNTGGSLIGTTNYKWITHDVPLGAAKLSTIAPNGFLVGIEFLYNYPASDGVAVDTDPAGTGGPHDWAYTSAGWAVAPYGTQMIRALVTDTVANVETTTMGQIRSLYR
jgi:hypothetical protein